MTKVNTNMPFSEDGRSSRRLLGVELEDHLQPGLRKRYTPVAVRDSLLCRKKLVQ